MSLVSIIMGIYNCEKVLPLSIDSIIKQSYTNWELIMCDDGSTDNTYKVAESYKEKYPEKIVLLKNTENMGLNFTLNKCAEFAKGEYIARQDADDISYSERFLKQVEMLDGYPDIAIVSADMSLFDNKGVWGKTNLIEFPQKKDFIKGNPFAHPASMYRKEVFKEVNGYSESKILIRVEDYHLWYKMYKKSYKGLNIKEPLVYYRDDYDAARRRNFQNRINESRLRYKIFKEFKLPKQDFVFVVLPLITALLPIRLIYFLHKQKIK